MNSIEPLSLGNSPMPVSTPLQDSPYQAVPSAGYETMAYATRSQTRLPLSERHLNPVPNRQTAPKRRRKQKCKKHSSASMSQSSPFMLNNMRTSGITQQRQAGKAPEPEKLCTDGEEDTLEMRAPTPITGSTSYVEISSNNELGETCRLVEEFVSAELPSFTYESVLQLVEGFTPIELGALCDSPDERLPSQRNPTCATPRAEEALTRLNNSTSSQQDPSPAAPRDKALATLEHCQSPNWQQLSCVAAEVDVPVLPSPCQTPNSEKVSCTGREVEAPAPCKVDNSLHRQQPPVRSKKSLCSKMAKNVKKQLRLLQKMETNFTSFVRHQTKYMQMVMKLQLRTSGMEDETRTPGPETEN